MAESRAGHRDRRAAEVRWQRALQAGGGAAGGEARAGVRGRGQQQGLGLRRLLLNAYSDKDLLARANWLLAIGTPAGVAAVQAQARLLFPDDNHRVRRILAYVLVQGKTGAAARPANASAWAVGAAAGPAVAVPDGAVSVYEHVASGGGGTSSFAFDYRGAHAEETGWLQFVGEEIERFDASTGGTSLGYFVPSSPLHGTGQPNEPIDWNTGSDRHWYLDALSDQMPFYESPVSATPPSGFMGAGRAAPARSPRAPRPPRLPGRR